MILVMQNVLTHYLVKISCQYSMTTIPFKPEIECGKPNRRERIINGNVAEPNEYPWMAALFAMISKVGEPFPGEFKLNCGAVLISKKWVASAGHCL